MLHALFYGTMNPYRLLLGLFIALFCTPVFAQSINSSPAPEGYDLSVETVAENIGPLIGALGVTDLTGFSCTRIYVTMNNETDFMSSVSGDQNNPTYVNTTTTFYQAALGAATPNGINSLLFPVYPDLAYDSWVTIGLEGVPDALAGEAAVATVQATSNPWVTNFDPGAGLPGASIVIDDLIGGAWYALNGDANGVAGEDLKVLVGQFTTTGEISGQMYCQVFIQGDGQDEFRDTFYFGPGSEIESVPELILTVALDEHLAVHLSADFTGRGELADEHFQVFTGDTVGITVQGIPSATDEVIDDNAGSGKTRSRIEVGHPGVACSLYRSNGGFSGQCVRHTFETDGHPAVIGQVGIDREEQAVDAVRGCGAQCGLIEGGRRIDVGRIVLVTGNGGHEVRLVVHGDVDPGAGETREVGYAQCADEWSDVFGHRFDGQVVAFRCRR